MEDYPNAMGSMVEDLVDVGAKRWVGMSNPHEQLAELGGAASSWDYFKAAMSGMGSASDQVASLTNAVNADTDGSLAKHLENYGATARGSFLGQGLSPELYSMATLGLKTDYAAQVAAAMGKNTAYANVGAQLADLMNEYQVVPDELLDSLGRKAGFLHPKSPERAAEIAKTEKEIKERVEQFVEKHPDKIENAIRRAPARQSTNAHNGSGGDLMKFLADSLEYVWSIFKEMLPLDETAMHLTNGAIVTMVYLLTVFSDTSNRRNNQEGDGGAPDVA